MERRIAVLGGDRRQIWLAKLLADDGYDVVTWGLDPGGTVSVPLHEALARECLIFPLPVCRNGMLNLPLTDSLLSEEVIWPKLSPQQLLLGGMTAELSPRLREQYGLTMLDYYQREELQVANAVPTAEGAIQLAMEHTEHTVHGSSCLVMGCGRIGKALAQRLHGLGAKTAVSARQYSDLAWIDACGWESLKTNALQGHIGRFDLIFNTIPACVLDAGLLRELKPSSLVIDLASAPGGVDAAAARSLSRQVIAAPGLPGKAAPFSAAVAVRDSIYHILEERGDIV